MATRERVTTKVNGKNSFCSAEYVEFLTHKKHQEELKLKESSGMPKNVWETIAYITGWITGVFQALFWIIAIIIYIYEKEKDPSTKFFNHRFHKFVQYYGIAALILIGLMILIIL